MFKKGDKVKIRGGYFKGRIGEFIKMLETPEFVEGGKTCLVQGVDFEGIFFTGNLELVSTEHTPSQDELNYLENDVNMTAMVSERVRLSLLLNSLYGKFGLSSYFDTDGSHYDLESDDIMTENNLLKPNHYQTKNGDLFDEWYERYPFDVFRIVLLATAERYFRRYHLKDGLDGLNKGIEVMKRLEEYELKEKNND